MSENSRGTPASSQIIFLEDKVKSLEAEVAELRGRLRKTAQILIAEVGADGPMNAEDAAANAVAAIEKLTAEVVKYHLLKDAVNSDSGDCTAECDSHGHADDCTWFDAADVIERLKAEVAELREVLDAKPSPYHCDASCPNYGLDAAELRGMLREAEERFRKHLWGAYSCPKNDEAKAFVDRLAAALKEGK